MKKISIILAGATIAFGMASCKSGKVTLSTNIDSASYANGITLGKRMAMNIAQSNAQGQPIDSTAFLEGFKAGASDTTRFSYYAGAMTGVQVAKGLIQKGELNKDLFIEAFEEALKNDTTKFLLSDSLANVITRNYQEKMQQKEIEKRFGKNKKEGTEFIEKFKKENPSAKTTASGLVYLVEKEGNGVEPTAIDTVEVSYKGTLIDGKEFDSTPEGKTTKFAVNQVVKGWTEMLELMKPGEKVKVVIPSDLAYGERGNYGIEPFSTLVFDLELVKVIKGDAKSPIQIK